MPVTTARSIAFALFAFLAAACGDAGTSPQLPWDAIDAKPGDVAPDGADDAAGDADAAPEVAEPDTGPARIPVPVRVATWNVRRFFDATCDSAAEGKSCGGWNDFEELPTADEFAYKAGDLAESIEAFGADVVILQEVENQAALDGLLARMGEPWATAYLGETGSPGSVDVAVLARFPFIQAHRHRKNAIPLEGGGTTWFAREFLEVHVSVPGAEGTPEARLIVFAAHFKAKSNDDPARRLAEARAAHDIVTARAVERPDAFLVLGGDLNDVPGSPPLAALETSGALLRVAADVPAAYRWTFRFNGKEQAIDHLFMATGAAGRYVAKSAQALRDHPNGLGSSDHGALMADFVF